MSDGVARCHAACIGGAAGRPGAAINNARL